MRRLRLVPGDQETLPGGPPRRATPGREATSRRTSAATAGTSPKPSGRPKAGRLSRRKSWTGVQLVAPAFLVVAVFFLAPLIYAFYISLTNWPLVGSYHFVGFANYTALLHDSVFLHSIVFTLEYTAIVTPCLFLIGYGLAALVRRKIKGVGFFRTMYFLPTVVGLSTVSFM